MSFSPSWSHTCPSPCPGSTGGGDQTRPRPLSQPAELHPIMAAALISNKPEFVKLFLENGLRLKDFVTCDTLLYLYENLDPACLFWAKLQKVLAEEPATARPPLRMHHVAQVLRELLGDSTQPLYPRPRPGERPHLLLPVPHVKLNVRAGDTPHPHPRPARGGLRAGPLLSSEHSRKRSLCVNGKSSTCGLSRLSCREDVLAWGVTRRVCFIGAPEAGSPKSGRRAGFRPGPSSRRALA